MQCPHCLVTIHASWFQSKIYYSGKYIDRAIDTTECPSCDKLILRYNKEPMFENGDKILIDPMTRGRSPVPPQVPASLAQDYVEACAVLPVSPKASAALSRRCLQSILRAHGYKEKDLAREIDAILNETDASKAIPSSLRDVIDGIRNFGNFSAHPITDVTTLQIIDVEEHEADWCLEIIEEMFDHFYVRPAATAARKAALNAKLASAGKPPAK